MASLMRVFALAVGLLFMGAAGPAFAKGATCAAAKTQVTCSKKAGCSWNGKACATGKAVKAKPAKAKAEKKSAKSTKAKKEPAAVAPTPAPTEEPAMDDGTAPAGDDMPPPSSEGDEDF